MTGATPRPIRVVARVAEGVTTLAWHPRDRRLAVGDSDGSVTLVDPGSATAPDQVTRHGRGVRALAWDPGSGTLASGGHDGRVTLHDLQGTTTTVEVGSWVHGLSWHRSLLGVVCGHDVSVLRHDGSLVRAWPLQRSSVLSVVWAPREPPWLLVGGPRGVRAFSPDDPSPEPVWVATRVGAALALDVHPGGHRVAVADLAGEVRVLPIGGDEEHVLSGYPDRVRLVRWCHGGRALAAEADDEVTVWPVDGDAIPGDRPVHLVRHPAPVSALASHPTSELVASGDGEGGVRIWSSTTGDVVTERLGEGAVCALAWSPDGWAIAVGMASGAVGLIPAP